MDNQQVIPTERLAYVGGLLDGEGCVFVYARNRANRTDGRATSLSFKPGVRFTNTERALVDEYISVLDALHIPYHVTYRAPHGRNAASWTVSTEGIKRVMKILPLVIQWCRGKKRDNARDLLAFCESRLADWVSAPFTPEQLALVERVYSRNYGHRRLNLRDYTRSARSSKYPRDDIVQTTTP